MCENCKALQAEVKRLERKNAKLRRLVKMAKKVIKAQRDQLDRIRTYAWTVVNAAKKAMSKHLPRGTWSLWKGKLEVAQVVFDMASANHAARFLEMLAEIGL